MFLEDGKGTLRPDWICMRVVPLDRPWNEHQPLHVFDFLISLLTIWKDLKILSRFIQKWIQPPACSDYGLYRILSSYWLAHFYLVKKSAKVLHYSGTDCGMLEFFNILLTSCTPKTNCWLSRIFGDRFDTIQPVTQQVEGLYVFLYEAAQNFEVFSKIQDQN